MNGPPDDPAARRELLERWAAQQRGTPSRARRVRMRVQRQLTAARGTMPRRLARGPQRFANRMLERGLDTSGDAFAPEHDHPDRLPYATSGWHVLPRALRYLGVSERDTFV